MDFPPTLELLKVASFQETLHGGYCGPACLKMVLAYFGIEKTEEEVATLCNRDSVLGTNAMAIKHAAETYGMQVEVQNGANFEDIRSWLAKKIPIIVNWFTRGRSDYSDSTVPDGHYSVVVGLDESRIYLQDPEIGELRTINRDDFLRVWFDFTGEYISWDGLIVRQMIVVYPKS